MAFTEQQQSLLGTQALALANSMDEIYYGDAVQDVAYAATVTTTVSRRNTVVNVAALTGNITIAAPLNPRKGMKLTYNFIQDGTGGRTVTWNAIFAASANSGSTANHVASTTFVYTGTRWVQEGGALTFKA